MVKLHLNKELWLSEKLWFSGYIISGEHYLQGPQILKVLSEPERMLNDLGFLNQLNGLFTIILKTDDEVLIVSDKSRSFPIYYSHIEGEWHLSDREEELFSQLPQTSIDDIALSVFLASGYCSTNRTLVKQIKITEPCGVLRFFHPEQEPQKHTYLLRTEQEFKLSEQDLAARLNNLLHRVFKRAFSNLGERQIAIPLSGGYDSRLIALMAKKYHKGSILTYTYGTEGNCELNNARRAANVLDLKWFFIEYNDALIKDFYKNPGFQKYAFRAAKLSASFSLQDYFAVKYLHEQGMLDADVVFVSGISGDAFAGSFLIEEHFESKGIRQVKRLLQLEHLNQIGLSYKDKRNIDMELESFVSSYSAPYFWQHIENWCLFQRQSKFIINQTEIYPHFGYEYLLPFWDNELILFFEKLPIELKLYKKLYDEVVENMFTEAGVYFKQADLQVSAAKVKWQLKKKKIKTLLPSYITNLFINKETPFLYEKISVLLKDQIPRNLLIKPRQSNCYNSYLGQWYWWSLKKLMKSD